MDGDGLAIQSNAQKGKMAVSCGKYIPVVLLQRERRK